MFAGAPRGASGSVGMPVPETNNKLKLYTYIKVANLSETKIQPSAFESKKLPHFSLSLWQFYLSVKWN